MLGVPTKDNFDGGCVRVTVVVAEKAIVEYQSSTCLPAPPRWCLCAAGSLKVENPCGVRKLCLLLCVESPICKHVKNYEKMCFSNKTIITNS
jgi:hypothetical protein